MVSTSPNTRLNSNTNCASISQAPDIKMASVAMPEACEMTSQTLNIMNRVIIQIKALAVRMTVLKIYVSRNFFVPVHVQRKLRNIPKYLESDFDLTNVEFPLDCGC